MIIYKDIIEKLNKAGYTLYRIRMENILSQSVLSRIRKNQPLSTETLDKICSLLNCNIEDIVEYKPSK